MVRSVTMIRRNRGAVAEDSGGSRVKRPKLGGRLPGKLGNAAGDSARGLGLVHCYWRRKLEDTSGEQASRASGCCGQSTQHVLYRWLSQKNVTHARHEGPSKVFQVLKEELGMSMAVAGHESFDEIVGLSNALEPEPQQ